jgi:hypothetical protein
MVARSVTNMKEEICPELELLNRACLDLVAQIERLEKENVRLRQEAIEGNGSPGRSGLSDNTR